MGALLSYSIVSGIVMLAMYLAYRVFLAAENQHAYNRVVLMAIYLISFAAVPVIAALQGQSAPAVAQGIVVSDVQIVEAATDTQPLWPTILLWIYLAGMIVVAIKTIATWAKILATIRTGQRIKQDGYTIVLTRDQRFAPFSWMRYIVITPDDYTDNRSAIITHELKHIASHHWIDLLVAQMACIVNWFNPAAWLMRDELMLVHEYQADMAVIDSGNTPRDYQLLLIKKAVGVRFPSLANSLNHSKLKKRITMMYKPKSGVGRKTRALALVPMLALAISVAEWPTLRAAVLTINSSDISLRKGNDNSANTTDTASISQIKVIGSGTMKKNVYYGSIKYSDSKYYLNDKPITEEEMKNISPDDISRIDVDKAKGSIHIYTKDVSEVREVMLPTVAQDESQPKYPGGMEAFFTAIIEEMKWPEGVNKNADNSGRVLISFTVNTDGSVSDVKPKKSCGNSDLDAEAIRAVQVAALKQPWTPAMQDGKPVAVSCVIPVIFKAQ